MRGSRYRTVMKVASSSVTRAALHVTPSRDTMTLSTAMVRTLQRYSVRTVSLRAWHACFYLSLSMISLMQ